MAGIVVENSRSRVHRGIGARLLLGLVVGVLIFYAASVASAFLTAGGIGTAYVATTAVAVLAGVTVFVGWRWPIVGLTAGILILACVLFAGITGISTGAPASPWLDLPGVLGHGAASGYPSIIGVVLVCSSIIRRLPIPRG